MITAKIIKTSYIFMKLAFDGRKGLKINVQVNSYFIFCNRWRDTITYYFLKMPRARKILNIPFSLRLLWCCCHCSLISKL